MATFNLTRKGQPFTVESTLTNEQAVAIIGTKVPLARFDGSHTFAGSLLAQYNTKGKLSLTQWGWLHHLAIEATAPAPAPATADVLLRSANLFDMLKAAASQIKFPKVVVWATLDNGYRLSVAGARAKVPGSLTVTSAERDADGQREWFGRVLEDGTIHKGRNWPTWLTAHLQRFADQPAVVAQESSRLHGACSFCNRALKDERSTEVGYGPQCASRFGLPWGTKAASLPTLDATEQAMHTMAAKAEAAAERRGFASDPDYRLAMANS